ncbi:glycosyl transferase [Amycolatopsis anabasis]|uniref:glycosyl transferase n=1 Tax=Amycolatopsis anabasis TaxID=1840409 RepID=UPI001FE40622|nr:glycosyl transferase [Amycolatopsis anabasis]
MARRVRWVRADFLVLLGYLVAALVVIGPLWMDLRGGYLVNSMQDQNMWEWFFAVTARKVAELENPLTTDLQNHPLGVNLMANTAMLGIGIPLAPVTWLFGPTVTFALALTGGLAGTAAAWFLVLHRGFGRSRPAAALGGAFCGFAPPIISHANAHPNFVVLFLLPVLVLRVIRLGTSTRPVRDGVHIGLLVTAQIFLGEEPLLLGAITFGVFAACYAMLRPREVGPMLRPLARGLGVAAGVSLVLCGFPLWWQFFGPQSYGTLWHGLAGNDLAAFTSFATESIAGDPAAAREYSLNRTEENAFFGWPLVILFGALTICLWRNVLARALALATLALAWLSFGIVLIAGGAVTAIPGPWLLLFHLPLLDSVLVSRFALGCVPLVGVLLALATDRALAVIATAPQGRRRLRVLWWGVLAAVLVPIAPTPLEAAPRPATPAFFADGAWQRFVTRGSVVVVPLPDSGDARALHWQVAANLGFPLAEGYFVGPDGSAERNGTYGARRTRTSQLLEEVGESGVAADVGDAERDQAAADLRFWGADVVVLPPHEHFGALRASVTALLGDPGGPVDGVWAWDVRTVTQFTQPERSAAVSSR